MNTPRALLCAFLALLCAVQPVRADVLQPGYLELTETAPDTWTIVWKAPILGGIAVRARPSLPGWCRVSRGEPRLQAAALVETLQAKCSRPLANGRVGLAGLERGYTDALLRIAPLGEPVMAERLTPEAPYITVPARPDRWEVLRTYLGLGIEHILTGWDHFLFVLCLVLLIRRGWQVAKTVTAFTLAHSLTLAATTLGLFTIPRRPVEICIALSIVFLAVEIVKEDPAHPRLTARVPWLVAFAFGLLHGFGFAAALAEIGVPQSDVPAALFSFNVGVEIGQLAIVTLGFAVIALVRRFAAQAEVRLRHVAAYLIGSTAAFWMIQRAVG